MLLTPLVLLLTSLSCKETPPEPPKPATLALRVEDASCTEAWLKATTTEVPATVALLRDNQRVSVIGLRSSDSLLIDEGLLPRRTYTYQLQKLNADSSVAETSASVQVTTMDTTSHNWSFSIDTLGTHSSVLYDVAIINDTLAYAVGEIFHRDSSENWTFFNLAKWNGRGWELRRVRVLFRGSLITPSLNGIFALSAGDIWLAGGMAIHGDGTNWVGHDVRAITGYDTLSFTKCWGRNSSDMYFVGLRGSLAHYNGSTWRRLESRTRLPIMDVFGARDDASGRYEILCVSADQALPGRSQVLAIENLTVREVATHPLWEPWGIWFVPQRRYITVGDGLWETRSLVGTWVRNSELPALFKTSIDGQALNDIVVGGAFWLLAHNNGASWQTYFPRTSGSFTAVQLKNNLILAVGGIGNLAVAVQGRR
jgi:hypothetical protein